MDTDNYELFMYNLIDTKADKVLKRKVNLTKGEAECLNYAYALNRTSKKYIKVPTAQEEVELDVFHYEQPI